MKRWLIVLGVVCGLCLTTGAYAQDNTNPKIESQVRTLLGGFEHVPSMEDWQKLGPGAADVLRQIATDPHELNTRRSRALSALSHFPTPEAKQFLQDFLNNAQQPTLLRRKAVLSLAYGFGPDIIPVIEPFLADQNKRMRESAILAVGNIATPRAKELLEKRLEIEPTNYLKETIEKTLKTKLQSVPSVKGQ